MKGKNDKSWWDKNGFILLCKVVYLIKSNFFLMINILCLLVRDKMRLWRLVERW